MFEVSNSVPLTGWQKARLVGGCVPFVVFIVLTLLCMTVLRDLFRDNSFTIFILFMGVVLLVLGFQAVQRARDLLSGMALVEEDVLERSWRGGGRGNATYFGKFERLGRLRLMSKAHFQSHNGMRYRVIYSPVSRIVWTLEPRP